MIQVQAWVAETCLIRVIWVYVHVHICAFKRVAWPLLNSVMHWHSNPMDIKHIRVGNDLEIWALRNGIKAFVGERVPVGGTTLGGGCFTGSVRNMIATTGAAAL